MSPRSTAILSLAMLALASPGAIAQASFRILPAPRVADPTFSILPLDMSQSGSHITGFYQQYGVTSAQAWRWDRDGGFKLLQADPAGGFPLSDAWEISDDGRRIAGTIYQSYPTPSVVVVWDSPEHPRRLPMLGGAAVSSIIPVMPADGSRIVFTDRSTGTSELVAWEGGDSVRRLYSFEPGLVWLAPRISADGSTIVGKVGPTSTYCRGFLLQGQEITYIDDFPGGRTQLAVTGASDRGRVAVGGGFDPNSAISFIWTRPTGLVRIGVCEGATPYSSNGADAVSPDGRMVIGTCQMPSPPHPRQEVYLWMAHTGMVPVSAILIRQGVAIPSNYYPWGFGQISADGTVIAGSAYNRDTQSVDGFIATIPRPCYADCNNSGSLDFNDYLCFLVKYQNADPATNPIDFLYCDFNGDDTVDFNDYLEFLNLYNAGC